MKYIEINENIYQLIQQFRYTFYDDEINKQKFENGFHHKIASVDKSI